MSPDHFVTYLSGRSVLFDVNSATAKDVSLHKVRQVRYLTANIP